MVTENTASSNLLYAQQGVASTKKVATIGAQNKLEDIIGSAGWSIVCVGFQRKFVNDPSPECIKDIPQWITSAAYKLLTYGCGNCGEQTAYAMVLLYKLGVRPLDYMTVAGGDHAFLLIGSSDNGPMSSYETWGETAVVCDPWDNQSYLGKTSGGKRAGAKSTCSLARVV